MVFNGAWDGVGPYKCWLSSQQSPLSVMAASEPPFYTTFRPLKRQKKKESVTSNAFRPIGQPYLHLAHADFLSVVIV